jgi:hypothetical protein
MWSVLRIFFYPIPLGRHVGIHDMVEITLNLAGNLTHSQPFRVSTILDKLTPLETHVVNQNRFPSSIDPAAVNALEDPSISAACEPVLPNVRT